MTVWTWPHEWYRFSTWTFNLRSLNLSAQHRWTGGRSVYGPLNQLWVGKYTLSTQAWDDYGQEMSAFFSLIGGQSGLVRIGDPQRRMPQRDRKLIAPTETFSDGTLFTDGTGFTSGLLPDFVTVNAAAAKGASYIVVDGLPASEAAVLRRGDLIELRPGGVPSETPNLYEIQFNASSDANGRTGLTICPPLRQGFAPGDMVILRYPTTVMRLVDDEQGAASVALAGLADIGFSVVEAIV